MSAPLLINGLSVDADQIGQGLYRIICEMGQEAIVAFGMLPAELMNSTEKMLREKVIAEYCKQVGCTPRELELMGCLDEKKVKATVRPIMHAVSVAIYSAASQAGKMCV